MIRAVALLGKTQVTVVEALVGGHPARALLNCGASHSFVPRDWLETTGFPGEICSIPLRVTTACATESKQSDRITEELVVNVGGCTWTKQFRTPSGLAGSTWYWARTGFTMSILASTFLFMKFHWPTESL